MDLLPEISNQIYKLPDIITGSDLVIGVGLVQGVPTAAEKLNIPFRFLAFYPGIMGVPRDGPLSGRLVWGFGKWATNITLLKLINQKRKEIGLKPIFNVWANWMGENVILASEKALIPVSEQVDFRFTQTGFMFLPALKAISDEVEKFLSAGEPPVFIGFGSNPIHKPEKYGQMMAEVAKTTGKRLIVSKGWSAIGSIKDSENILFVDEVPFDLLFPRVAMVVHHGGIGTMAAAARAGVPQAAFPFMADQFMNQAEMIKMGISPITTSFKKMNAENLSQVIKEGLVDRSYRVKAAEIALKVNGHNGTDMTVEVIEKLAVI
jgi:vancomycin aglycone glucosyltransferase